MNNIIRNLYLTAIGVFLLGIISFFCPEKKVETEPAWPQITKESKPWSRWWWLGSIVNPADLTYAMGEYQKVGLGGLEITPIYGVKGYEDKFINYLSPEWVNMLIFTLKEGKRLDLGIDMAGSSGWPFGGPLVTAADACKNIVFRTYTLNGGHSLSEKIEYQQQPLVRAIGKQIDISEIVEPVGANKNLQKIAFTQVRYPKKLPLQVLMGFSESGKILNLTDKVDSTGNLKWMAPVGKWVLYALFEGWHGKLVERAGPGGEGDVIDHFSATAIDNHLAKFHNAFLGKDIHGLRGFFNDSYEVDDAVGQADWTPELFEQFLRLRGYDLREKLPALFGNDNKETNSRVLCDYRETISDLLLENFTIRWRKWANKEGFIIRNQAHGSPANILDLYAASDIPETEGSNIQKIKFASSAAHITGKVYTSSESCTLLNEHFISPLSKVKPVLDRDFLGGVNHVFYHGIAFSPKDEKWPGWLFYAAVHFSPANSFWTDFSQVNKYAARCQSLLQSGKPDNEVLFYNPIYDRWSEKGRGGLLEHFGGGTDGTAAGINADTMLKLGFSYDFISDRQIKNLGVENNLLQTGGNTYRTIVLPRCQFIPVETFQKLIELAKSGATIIIYQELPQDVPGMADLDNRRKLFQQLKNQLNFKNTSDSTVTIAGIGSGKFLLGSKLENLLNIAGIKRETMADLRLSFIRRKGELGKTYFILNQNNNEIDGWVPLQSDAVSVAIFNPMTDEVGIAKIRSSQNGTKEVYLQLAPGESCLLKTYNSEVKGKSYRYVQRMGDPIELTGKWKIKFIMGGPELPGPFENENLGSWTNLDGEETKAFSGTAEYSISFSKPDGSCDGWVLDLGRVCESARVILNGKELGTLIEAPYRILIPTNYLTKNNNLKVRVSNLMANRIADLDRHTSDWKKFYNVNFPGRLEQNRGPDRLFTAKNWPPMESGLIGPVRLTSVKLKEFNESNN